MDLGFATEYWYFNILLFIIGITMLLKGSDWFVNSSSFFAFHFQVSEILIGLTLVSIGTSLPEFATNIYASFKGQGEVALGNVVGSNISNIALIMGLGCILKKQLAVPKTLLKRDGTIMLILFSLFFLMALVSFQNQYHKIARFNGALLLIGFAGYCYILYKKKSTLKEATAQEHDIEEQKIKTLAFATFYFFAGLGMIFLGAKISVDTVVKTAEKFNISKEIISSTVIAFGTSVPELAVTITSIIKKKNDLALGNIIGSCIFNLILIMGVTILITPVPVSENMIKFLLPLMFISGASLLFFMKTGNRLVRGEGACLLLLYIIFILHSINVILA